MSFNSSESDTSTPGRESEGNSPVNKLLSSLLESTPKRPSTKRKVSSVASASPDQKSCSKSLRIKSPPQSRMSTDEVGALKLQVVNVQDLLGQILEQGRHAEQNLVVDNRLSGAEAAVASIKEVIVSGKLGSLEGQPREYNHEVAQERKLKAMIDDAKYCVTFSFFPVPIFSDTGSDTTKKMKNSRYRQEQSFFLQTLLFTAFVATVQKIITYALVST